MAICDPMLQFCKSAELTQARAVAEGMERSGKTGSI